MKIHYTVVHVCKQWFTISFMINLNNKINKDSFEHTCQTD